VFGHGVICKMSGYILICHFLHTFMEISCVIVCVAFLGATVLYILSAFWMQSLVFDVPAAVLYFGCIAFLCYNLALSMRQSPSASVTRRCTAVAGLASSGQPDDPGSSASVVYLLAHGRVYETSTLTVGDSTDC